MTFDALAIFKEVVNTHHELMGYPAAFPAEVAVVALHDPPCPHCGGVLLRGDHSARCGACGHRVEQP